ncbi:PTS transporter subunit EIIC [Clostridium sp. LP20]|uniref:PTS transporter subunit EIIC n=1 Tax=Clostridium sp. LP20 TaxID=3418665 RepID=UPI003EE69303
MNKLITFIEGKVLPIANKVGQQRHLMAISDGFLTIIALTIVASLATLITNVPLNLIKGFLTNNSFGKQIYELCQNISWGAFAFMALFTCIAVAQALWHSYDKNGFEGGLIAAAVFLAVSKQTLLYKPEGATEAISVKGGLAANNFGATTLFTGIIIALITIELLRYLSGVKWLEVRLPEMVPPAVSRSFKTI